MFIQTQSTLNPSSLMFYPGKPVMEGVVRVFFGSDFVTVTKSDDVSWDILNSKYLQRSWISTLLASLCFWTHKLLLPRTLPSTSFVTQDASETVAMVKELLETCIRPAVQDDVGDIEYCGFDPESGIVKLRLQGAYSGCPSSSVTLKSGIESMLMHYV